LNVAVAAGMNAHPIQKSWASCSDRLFWRVSELLNHGRLPVAAPQCTKTHNAKESIRRSNNLMKIYSAHHSRKYSIVILLPVLVGLLFVQLTKAETWAIVSSGTEVQLISGPNFD
jgi:hypothetical protein